MADLNDVLNIVSSQNITGRVAWIDDDDGSYVDSEVSSTLDSLDDVIWVDTPLLILLKEVFDHCSSI